MIPHTIRFPTELHEKIREIARAERRSFNSQVIFMLDQQIKWREEVAELDQGSNELTFPSDNSSTYTATFPPREE